MGFKYYLLSISKSARFSDHLKRTKLKLISTYRYFSNRVTTDITSHGTHIEYLIRNCVRMQIVIKLCGTGLNLAGGECIMQTAVVLRYSRWAWRYKCANDCWQYETLSKHLLQLVRNSLHVLCPLINHLFLLCLLICIAKCIHITRDLPLLKRNFSDVDFWFRLCQMELYSH